MILSDFKHLVPSLSEPLVHSTDGYGDDSDARGLGRESWHDNLVFLLTCTTKGLHSVYKPRSHTENVVDSCINV